MNSALTNAARELDPMLDRLVETIGEAHRERLRAGLARVSERWTAADGDAEALEAFCRDHFITDPVQRRRLVDRLEIALEQVGGHLYEMRRALRRWSDLRVEELPRVDDLLATFDPAPDLSEQLYRQRLAFVALLNLDRPNLDQMLREGDRWSVEQWAEARIAQAFGPRVPIELNDLARTVNHAANQWVSRFHVPVGGLVDREGRRCFEQPRALLAHWLVREEIKARYNDANGLSQQRALAWVMARHIDGSIPRTVFTAPGTHEWDPERNTLDGRPADEFVGPVRYEQLLSQRGVATRFDVYYTEQPTAMARKFELAREIPEHEVERLMTELLDHPVRAKLASFLRRRLGRDLEPFDIYFDDIAEHRGGEELNRAVRRRFGDEKSLQAQLPLVLTELGFTRGDAAFIASRITVEIARGSGHAMRPQLLEYGAWLRTNRLEDELGWDGFDTAMHELGHTVEQVISANFAPRPALRGVPNTACTEAFAFLYQSLAKRVLGLVDPEAEERAFAIESVQTMLAACQIAGPSLLEIRLWRWLYDHPDASADEVRAALLEIADELWERFYRRDFGPDPYRILGAYQHMIAHPLYLADYTLGHVISHQVRSHLRGRDLAAETIRICSIGRVTPDLWMRRAVGGPISIEAMASDAAKGFELLSNSE